MPDRLGQEKDKSRSKTLLAIAGFLVAMNIVLFLFIPTQTTISYDTDAIIYSVADESFEKPCHVTIKGHLTQSVLLTDTFEGAFYITDVPGLEEDMTLHLERKNGSWEGAVHDSAGQPVATGVWDVEATKDFAHITIAFATQYEYDEQTHQTQSSFSADQATFLSLDAPNRAYALRQFQELILKQK